MNNSIHFPPGTISSKLSSSFLKKPPSAIDWVHQSYMDMIEDVSYTTTHYYESKGSGSSIMEAGAPKSTRQNPEQQQEKSNASQQCLYKSATDDYYYATETPQRRQFDSESNSSTSPSPSLLNRLKQVQEEEDDDDNNAFNTVTTASTNCNRIYRLYNKEQQSLSVANPMDQDDATICYRVITPHCSNNYKSEEEEEEVASANSPSCEYIDTQRMPKKKMKIIGKVITKMRIAAERPFWSIDNHF